ncbi:hypothetical protein CASFOL_026888 [Castilleja foliolosa]|uniref:Uncharacterized protein n=1 Tax=Castilleja foliolosa TaxID=1961234 RepID=A0ABD3CL45_9LAMI
MEEPSPRPASAAPDFMETLPNQIRKVIPKAKKQNPNPPNQSTTHPKNRRSFVVRCAKNPRGGSSLPGQTRTRYNHGKNKHPREVLQDKYKDDFKILSKTEEEALRDRLYQDDRKERFAASGIEPIPPSPDKQPKK